MKRFVFSPKLAEYLSEDESLTGMHFRYLSDKHMTCKFHFATTEKHLGHTRRAGSVSDTTDDEEDTSTSTSITLNLFLEEDDDKVLTQLGQKVAEASAKAAIQAASLAAMEATEHAAVAIAEAIAPVIANAVVNVVIDQIANAVAHAAAEAVAPHQEDQAAIAAAAANAAVANLNLQPLGAAANAAAAAAALEPPALAAANEAQLQVAQTGEKTAENVAKEEAKKVLHECGVKLTLVGQRYLTELMMKVFKWLVGKLFQFLGIPMP